MEISAIEYKMARRNQTRDHQTEELKNFRFNWNAKQLFVLVATTPLELSTTSSSMMTTLTPSFHHLMNPMRSAPIPKLRRIPNFRRNLLPSAITTVTARNERKRFIV